MFCKVALCLALGPLATSMPAAAESVALLPPKTAAIQKSFDFRRPDPGEILPNPAAGNGAPPHLKEYAPAKPSEAYAGGAVVPAPRSLVSGKADGGGGAQAPASGPSSQSSSSQASSSQASSSQASSGAAQTVSDAISLQASFAAQVVRKGIRGAFRFLPENIPSQDPSDVRRWLHWKQTLVAAQGARKLEPAEVQAEIGPGVVTISKAPPRVTGEQGEPQRR